MLFAVISILETGCERPTDADQRDDGIPPAVPVGLQISYAYDGEILIEWTPNSDADLKGYNLYRKTNSSDFQFLTFTTKSYSFDDSLFYDTTYIYKVSSVDIWGEESELSAEVSAAPVNRYKPQKVRYISINARNWVGKISIFINWTPNSESDIAGYNIYRSLNSSFNADSTSYIGFTSHFEFNDTNSIQLYTDYFYIIRAVDKGGMISDESSIVSDQVYDMPVQIFPGNDTLVYYFESFFIKTLSVPADYQIIVQSNEYYGEFWSHSFSSSSINENIAVKFNPAYLYPYVYYYWRVLTFSNGNSEPNSISPLFKFRVKL